MNQYHIMFQNKEHVNNNQ